MYFPYYTSVSYTQGHEWLLQNNEVELRKRSNTVKC